MAKAFSKKVVKKAALPKIAAPKKAIKKTTKKISLKDKPPVIKKPIKKIAKNALPKKKAAIQEPTDILFITYGTKIKIKNSDAYEIKIDVFWSFEQYKYDYVDNIVETMDCEFPKPKEIKRIAMEADIRNSDTKLITDLSKMNGSSALDFLSTYLIEQSQDPDVGIGIIDGSSTKLNEESFFDVIFNDEKVAHIKNQLSLKKESRFLEMK